MKNIIREYITNAEELLLIYPTDKLIESYLLQLKSIKKVPDAYLNEFDTIIPTVYEAIKEVENIAQNEVMIKLFSNAVEAVKISVLTENPNAEYPDFDDIFDIK